jgi:phage-related protein
LEEGRQELDIETKRVLAAYLATFNTPEGQIVLADLKKSYHDKPFEEHRINDLGYLASRAAQHNVYLKIIRMRQYAAEEIQRTEGVTPVRTPEVIVD